MDEVASSIGDAAGYVYRLLVEGKANTAKVKRTLKKSGFDSETVLMAIGWLAREDKLLMEKNSDSYIIKLK